MTRPSMAPEAIAGLTALARALCGDGRIAVVAADCSAFNAGRHTIGIDVDPDSEPERARGLLAHECGHALISRYHLWPAPTFYRAIWFRLMNTLEDPRVDGWMIRRYAGSLPWFEAVARDVERIDPPPPESVLQQFSIAAAAIDHHGRSHLDRRDWLHPVAALVFDATRTMRRRYCETVPEPGIVSMVTPGEAPFCAPGGSGALNAVTACADPVEVSVRRSAYAAWRIARDEVLPAVMPLIDRDVARIVVFARRDAASDHALIRGDKAARIEMVRAALGQVAIDDAEALTMEPADDDRRKRAMLAFDEFIGGRGRSSTAGAGDVGDFRWPGLSEELLTEDDDAEGVKPIGVRPYRGPLAEGIEPRIRTQIAAMRGTLERVVVERRRARWRDGFRSGSTPDLRRLMRYEADRRDDRVWMRLLRRRDREATLGLLVDLSGSMSGGGKIEAAVAGTLLFAEAASAVGIDFVIDGFQDVLIPIAAIGEGFTPAVRRRIEEMTLEVINRRPDGNNASGNNDDGPCLDAIAGKLPTGAGRRNLLLVISDGLPAGLHSTADDLRRSIARLSARADLTLVGLGLGAETSHVRDFYPIALAEVPVERLAVEIGRILEAHCRMS